MVQLLKGLAANQLEIIIILTAVSIVVVIVTNFSPDYTWYSQLFWLIRLGIVTNGLEMLLTPLETVSDNYSDNIRQGFISFSEFII